MFSSVQNPIPLIEVSDSGDPHLHYTASTLGKPLRFLLTGCQLVLADSAAFLAGFGLMLTLRPAIGATVHEHLTVMLVATYFLVTSYGGGFSPAVAPNAKHSVERAWLGLMVTVVTLSILMALFGKPVTQIAATMIPALAYGGLATGLARLGLALLLSSHWWQARPGYRRTIVLLDGPAAPMGMAISEGILVDVQAQGLRADLNDPAALARLGKLTENADRVIVACHNEQRSAWIAALRGANVPVEVVVDEIGDLAPLGAGFFDGRTTLKVAAEPLSLGQRIVKRMFDIAFASLALAALLPLLLLAALAVKLDSRGPVMFRQPRIGRGNSMFLMHKFRSMRVEVQDIYGSQLTRGRDDDRITRVGRFIRGTSIDELPQLINVLRGDMSIVGPRPHALGAKAGHQLYWEVDGAYWHRHAVKPGLTGLAQVRGFRGTTFADTDLRNRLKSDLEYVRTWSLSSDIRIIFRTVMALTGQSAF